MPFYDPYTGQEVETEEEKQRREQEELRRKELANTAVQTEEIKTYGDGTVERITKEEIAPEMQPVAPEGFGAKLGNAVSQAGTNFVNNLKQAPENFARNLQQGVTNLQNAPANFAANVQGAINPNQPEATQAPKPQFDRNAYNTSIAQQESGNRADIGYHDRTKSTAYGQYGITAPAYQDARRRDPSLPEDITKATPEQQTTAHNIITDNNAKFLQSKGIEATPGVLAAAHFTGAGGLHKFLTQTDEQGRPFISPQAQAANGGYDKARAIIEGRLNGQAVPASGATQRSPQAFPQEGVAVATGQGVQGTMETPTAPTQPVSPYSLATGAGQQGLRVPGQMQAQPQPEIQPTKTAIDRYQEAQDDPIALMQLRSDTTQPEYIRQRAGTRVAEMITSENNRRAAETTLPTLGQSELAKIATKKSEGNSVGDWMQYLLFKHVGLNDLANQKAEQLGIGHQWTRSTITDATGNSIPVEIQTTASGKLLGGNMLDGTPLTKEQLNMTGGALGKGTSVSAEVYVDTKTGARYRSGTDSQGNAAMINIQGGAPFRGNPRDLQVQSIGTAAAKAEQAAATSLRYAGPMAFNKASAGEAGKFSQQYGVNIDYATQTPGAPLMDKNTGKEVVPDANGNITVTKNGGGTITVATGQAPAQAQPAAAPAATDKLPKAPTMNAGESPAAFAARTKAWSDTYGKQYESQERNTKAAKDLLPYVTEMKSLIDKSTSSGIGAMFDSAGNFFGYSTAGAEAIAAIAPLANKVLMGVERFEGPQSDQDVKSYKEAAGRLADPTIPAAQKQASFNTIVEIMKRNAPDLNWDSVGGKPSADMTPQQRAQAELEKRKKKP